MVSPFLPSQLFQIKFYLRISEVYQHQSIHHVKKKFCILFLSKVTFLNVPSRYPGDDDVTVTYVLNGSWKRSSYDWIGLFKKGNEGVKDYVTYVWTGILSALPSSEENEVEFGRSVVCFQG